jgi:hypothetical protein
MDSPSGSYNLLPGLFFSATPDESHHTVVAGAASEEGLVSNGSAGVRHPVMSDPVAEAVAYAASTSSSCDQRADAFGFKDPTPAASEVPVNQISLGAEGFPSAWRELGSLAESSGGSDGEEDTQDRCSNAGGGEDCTADDPSIAASITEFVTRWGLDVRSMRLIQELPREMVAEVINDFDASSNTRNINAKFVVWLDSRMRLWEAEREQPDSTPPLSMIELQRFFQRWHLEYRTQKYVLSLPAAIQRKLVDTFEPPPGTNSVDGKLFAFARLQLQKQSAKCLRVATDKTVGSRLAQRKQEAIPRAHLQQTSGTGPGGSDEFQRHCVAQFAALWRLDEATQDLLQKVPKNVLEVVISTYRPPSHITDINKHVVGFVRSRQTMSANGRRDKDRAKGCKMEAKTSLNVAGLFSPSPPGLAAYGTLDAWRWGIPT